MKRQTAAHGFTLVEVMVAICCMCILMLGLMQVFRYGTRSSLRGTLQVETTLEARLILQQLTLDLKHLCVEAESGATGLFDQALKTSGTAPTLEYSFYVYPFEGSTEQVVSRGGSGKSYIPVSRVTYLLQGSPTPTKPYLKLIRREQLHARHPRFGEYPAGIKERTLSERVHVMQILPRTFQVKGYRLSCFWVNLQLVDSLKRGELVPQNLGQQLFGAPKDALIADFFSVVYPEFIREIEHNKGFNLNWFTGIERP